MSKMFCITEDGAFLASENITAVDFVNTTLTAQLNLFRQLVEQGQPIEQLYDLFNDAASAFLEVFAPDLELRPDLTAEAIMEMENQLLEKKVAELPTSSIQGDIAKSASKIKEEMIADGLIPLDSLDENGKPKKPVHSNVIPLPTKEEK